MSDLLGLDDRRATSTLDVGEYLGPDPEWAARVKRGANWFYWIAGLSVINSGAFLVGANFHFLAGLGLTAVMDAIVEASIQQGAPGSIKIIAVVFDLIVIIGFALAGYFANKYFQAAFIVGIVIYAIDGVLVLFLGDFLMAAFHAFALYSLIRGFIACREMKTHMKANARPPVLPPPPTFA